MIKRILIPLDGSPYSEQVLSFVQPLARSLKATVHLFHVADTSVLPVDPYEEYQPFVDRLLEEDLQRAAPYLTRLTEQLKAAGVEATRSAVKGVPGDAILEAAAEQHADLIAMSTHGRSGIARWLMGSVADKVVRSSAIPVLLYHPKEGVVMPEQRITAVCVPLDGTGLSEQALPTAEEIAGGLAVPLTVTRVIPTYLQVFETTNTVYVAEALKAIEKEAASYLQRAEDRLKQRDVRVETQLLRGDASAELTRLAESIPDSLVVMTSHSRSGIGRMILGSVTDKMVRSSSRPIIVVRAKERSG